MSSFMVLAETSRRLKSILWEAFSADALVRDILGNNEESIVFLNPTETARNSANRLSLWMYQINENEFLKNQPALHGNSQSGVTETPLALNLYYLITPFSGDSEGDLHLLGLTMQTLYDNGIVSLRNDDVAVSEELRIAICRLSLEELTRIWEALREPYRLSICYLVRVTRIDTQRRPQRSRVLSGQAGYGGMPVPG